MTGIQKNNLNVVINSPDKLVWEGKASSVSSKNSAGNFDILSGHANFITMVEKEPIVVRTGTGDHTFTYDNAVVSVQKGNVTIYAGI